MIKLELTSKPAQLTSDKERNLTECFKTDNGKAVWNKDYIKKALMEMSRNKCAYSEVYLGEESNYMEVDHFKCKSLYPDEVVKWGNLLPACKFCNMKKGNWDVVANPIINPLVDNPKDYLFVKGALFFQRNDKGRNTLDCLDLNNIDELVIPRARNCAELVHTLRDVLALAESKPDAISMHKIASKLHNLMITCDKNHKYSAVLSTNLLSCNYYKELKNILTRNNKWSNELQSLENALADIALPE